MCAIYIHIVQKCTLFTKPLFLPILPIDLWNLIFIPTKLLSVNADGKQTSSICTKKQFTPKFQKIGIKIKGKYINIPS